MVQIGEVIHGQYAISGEVERGRARFQERKRNEAEAVIREFPLTPEEEEIACGVERHLRENTSGSSYEISIPSEMFPGLTEKIARVVSARLTLSSDWNVSLV